MTPELKQRIEQTRTTLFKVVFPNTTNHYDTLFGGTAMKLMDEVAFITATRFCRKKVVTISSGQIDFKESIPADTIIELIGEVVEIGRTSLKVNVKIFQENMYADNTQKQSINGVFTFVALNNNNKPTAIL